MNLSPGMVVTVYFEGAHTPKRRPALVVSTDLYHATRPDIIVAVLTTNLPVANTPTDYILQDWAPAGLRYPSAFRAYFECSDASDILSTIG
ncbi:MAG: type II toxin-antitoxin system PemK/MazF family toxin [Gemmataceae bacterium]|nr:type II toxin-antitoxin system PemK/MazF family toxin [Gemmataceae bacterium]